MKNTVAIILLSISFISFTVLDTKNAALIPNSTGPAANGNGDRTGSPLSSSSCNACHSGGSFGATVSASVKNSLGTAVNDYTPGETYTLELTVTGNASSFMGVQGVALTSSNIQAGTLSNPQVNTKITNLSGRQYVEHTSTASGTGAFTFISDWTAPVIGTGNITIFAGGIVANGNGGTSGDEAATPFSLTLTEKKADVMTIDTLVACDSLTWSNGTTYYSNNTIAKDTFNLTGYDSIVTLDLTINQIDSSVTVNGIMLTANYTGGSYRWLDCGNNFAFINAEVNQSFTPTVNGSYAVEISDNGCVDTSNCIAINTVNVNENFRNSIKLFPNPMNNQFNILFTDVENEVKVTLRDVAGKTVDNKTYFNTKKINFIVNEKSGIYFIEVKVGDKQQVFKVLKN